jgi:hypothetical protein
MNRLFMGTGERRAASQLFENLPFINRNEHRGIPQRAD